MASLVLGLQRNTLFTFLSAFFRLAANAVLFILVARFYGPESFGQFSTAHTLSTVFILFADFGFDLLLTTEIAQHPEKSFETVPRMAAIKLVLATVATLGMAAFARLQNLSDITRELAYIFCFYLFFSAILNFMFALFRAHEKMQYESAITFIINLTLVVVLIFAGIFGVSLYIIAITFVGSRILGLLLALRTSRKLLSSMIPILDLSFIVNVWRQTFIFGAFFIFGNLFFTQDTILLSIWKGDYEVGIYQSAFRIIAIALIIPDIMFNAIIPTLARLYNIEESRWFDLGSFVSKVLYFLGMLIGTILVVLPHIVIKVAYGEGSFLEAIPVMRLFGLIIIVRYTFEVPALMLTTSHHQFQRMVLVFGATIFNFILNAYAIPKYGIIGAATVSLATNLAVGVGYAITSKNIFPQKWLARERMLPLVVIAIGYLATQGWPLNVGIVVLCMTICYFFVVYFFGFLPTERLRLAKTLNGIVKR